MRRLAAVAVGVAVAMTVAACGSDGSTAASAGSAGTATVKLSYIPYTGTAPLMLGIKQGIFAQHHIKLQLTKSQAVSAIVASLVNGEKQIGFAPVINVIQARSRGTAVKCLGTDQGVVNPANDKATLLLVKKGSPITSAKDLVGKKVGVAGLGGLNHLFVLDRVRAAGGDWTKVQVVQLPLPQASDALNQGRVDAVVGNIPFTSQMLAGGAVSLASQEADFIPKGIGACYVATDKWINSHPAEASNFQAANTASLKYANDHIKDALATLPSFLSMTPEQAAKQVPGSIYDPTFDMASVQKQMDEMVQFKFIPKALPIADVVYKSGS
jgi:NitT/TauT family transport system substrate-binding protein